MSIKEEFRLMTTELRAWNAKSGWDDTRYVYQLDHSSKKAKTMFQNELDAQKQLLAQKEKEGFTSQKYIAEMQKVIEDCQRSVDKMVII